MGNELHCSTEGYSHTCSHTHTLHLAAITFFFASYESHWLLKQDNCVNLLQNCLCLCSWITGAWDFFFFFTLLLTSYRHSACLWNGWMYRATSFPIRHSCWSALQAYIDEPILDVFSPASAYLSYTFVRAQSLGCKYSWSTVSDCCLRAMHHQGGQMNSAVAGVVCAK